MILVNIPIEPLEERYSMQWDKWFTEAFVAEKKIKVVNVYGKQTSGKINQGSFLDVLETNKYKTEQLLYIIELLRAYDNKEKCVLFFQDLWFPGLETIAYIRDGLKLTNLRICGCLHAGSYDPHDFLSKRGMNAWAKYSETAWLGVIVDEIFVATRYHRHLLCSTRDVPEYKVKVTGFPIYDDFVSPKCLPYHERERIIVFPHRLDAEKNPQMFDRLIEELEQDDLFVGWTFVKTKQITKNKREYFRLLEKAYLAVSFADQETWGIAMQEATICGCLPMVPDRLSYTEMYLRPFVYTSWEELKHRIRYHVVRYPHASWHVQKGMLLEKGAEAIPTMIHHIKEL